MTAIITTTEGIKTYECVCSIRETATAIIITPQNEIDDQKFLNKDTVLLIQLVKVA